MRLISIRGHNRKGVRVKAHKRRIQTYPKLTFGSGVKGNSLAARNARRRAYGAPSRR